MEHKFIQNYTNLKWPEHHGPSKNKLYNIYLSTLKQNLSKTDIKWHQNKHILVSGRTILRHIYIKGTYLRTTLMQSTSIF